MTQQEQDAKLTQALAQIQWPVQYGIITITVREGKATLVKIERTIKLD